MVEGQLSQGDVRSIRRCFHRMLPFLERKRLQRGGRRVGEGDYDKAGLMQEISRDDWKQFWARASAGKRGGRSGMHVSLLKAADKRVFVEVGKGGKASWVARTAHVMDGLRKLVNSARVGRFFYSDWEHELLYTFIKVPGAVGLENSRPVGMLEILQKASYAFDFGRITEVWEQKGLLHNSQYAFRAGRGTEGPLLLWSIMNDKAYLHKEDQARGRGI